jgi:circadian clock protein KaiC
MKSKVIRISTGIPNLDKLIEGGFKKNSINLVAGDPGSGKSIFAMQFLMEGIKKGEPGVFITFEEKKKKFYEDMLEFGWELEKYEKEKKFVFLEYTPEQVKKILTEGGGIVEEVIEKK